MPLRRKSVTKAILEFVDNTGYYIHPGKTAEDWAELVVKTGGCPCVPERKKCPCEEALEDIRQENCCRCRLFVNDSYIKLYNSLTSERRSRRHGRKG